MLEFRPVQAGSPRWLWLFVVMIAVAVLSVGLLMGQALFGRATLAYELTPAEVVIHYGSDRITVLRSAIETAQIVPAHTGGRRIFGTGMPGLYQGKWSFRETQQITLYASVQKQLVVLEAAKGKWGITPEDPEGFLLALKNGQTGTWAAAAGGSPVWFVLPFTVVTFTLLAGAVAVLIYYIRLPQSIRYVLSDEGVLIEGGRLRLTLPYREITSAQYASPKGGPFRLFGAEVPGLLWGRFRWKDAGPNLYLYATQRKPLVLIGCQGKTYGITPEAGERFLAELNQRLGRCS
ncbi:MAG TPA: PH domain-containing protein [Symbiobacteriaceae bacterium]|nr:PH domain-containing protein [Symbiobacteriaceae bacterium]